MGILSDFIEYTRINWKNGRAGGTRLSAENLNKMDSAIKNNNDYIKELSESAGQLSNEVDNKTNITNQRINSVINNSEKISYSGTYSEIFGEHAFKVVDNNGNFVDNTSWVMNIEPLKLPTGTKLSMNLNGLETTYGTIWIKYDANGTMIQRLFFNNTPTLSYTFGEGESVRIGVHILSGTTELSSYDLFNVTVTEPTNPLYNVVNRNGNNSDKYMAVLGDSISTYSGITESQYTNPTYPTANVDSVEKTWWKIVQTECGFNSTLAGISAIAQSAYRQWDNNQDKYIPAYDDNRLARLSVNHTPDYIFINMGTNDCFRLPSKRWNGEVLTTELETEVTHTAYGCALAIRKIQNLYPNAKIIIIIPKICEIGRDNVFVGENYKDVCDEIINVANGIGVYQIIDLRKSSITYTNAKTMMYDGIHPTYLGMQAMAKEITQEFLKRQHGFN